MRAVLGTMSGMAPTTTLLAKILILLLNNELKFFKVELVWLVIDAAPRAPLAFILLQVLLVLGLGCREVMTDHI